MVKWHAATVKEFTPATTRRERIGSNIVIILQSAPVDNSSNPPRQRSGIENIKKERKSHENNNHNPRCKKPLQPQAVGTRRKPRQRPRRPGRHRRRTATAPPLPGRTRTAVATAKIPATLR